MTSRVPILLLVAASLTAAAALIIITADDRESFGVLCVVGLLVWVSGFAIGTRSRSPRRSSWIGLSSARATLKPAWLRRSAENE